MKRKLWTGLAFALLVLLLCGAAAADGHLGDNINWYLSDDGILSIIGSGDIPDYYENERIGIPVSPLAGRTDFTQVIIGEGITRIGDNLFLSCSNLKEVMLPQSLTSIGSSAFGLTGLTQLELPHNLRYIEKNAFSGTPLTSVTLPLLTKSIAAYAFYSCSLLKEVRILNPVPVIGNNAFLDCSAKLVIHGWDNTSAEEYASDNGITFKALKESGKCGKTVTWTADPYTGKLTISGTGEMYSFTYDGSPWYDYRGFIYTLEIENGVTSVGDNAFSECGNLRMAVLSDSVKSIGISAFYRCINMSILGLPERLNRIGEYAFMECENLKSIDIPKGIKKIETSSFLWAGLKSVTIPEGVTEIGPSAFEDTRITSLRLPDTVQKIDTYAFSGCEHLQVLTLPKSVLQVRDSAFLNCVGLRSVTLFNAGTTLGSDVFLNCGSNMSIIGWSGSTAQTYAAANEIPFRSLDNVTFFLPDSLVSIDSESFTGIKAKAVVIPKTVTSITTVNPFSSSKVDTIYGYPGSTAENFAAANGYTFVPIDDVWMEISKP